MRRHRSAAVLSGLLILATTVARAQGQEPLEERVRSLYMSAAYEDALAELGDASRPDAQQYRVLSLLALGRQSEAKAALHALVTAAPDFPVSQEMPPRFVTMLDQARAELLPSLLRGLLTQGRHHYQLQEYEQARATFDRIVALASQPALKGASDVTDLRILADGYLELLREVRPQPRMTPEPAVEEVTAGTPAPEIRTPPSPLKQVLPWWPIDAGRIDRARIGLLHVRIGSNGEVLAATIIRSVQPLYDRQLLTATKNWQYKPATLNGVAIESESIVEVRPQTRAR